MRLPIKKRPNLPYVEVHLADGCNLNCKGCSHFSPLYSKSAFPDREAMLADIRRMTCLFEEIGHLRLLGGEPLLNPELLQLLSQIRDLLPQSRITLVTNGLLLDRWGAPLVKTLLRTNIALCITGYPCNQGNGGRAVAKLRAMGVNATMTPMTEYFRLFLHEKGGNGFDNCELRHCILMHRGCLWRCSLVAMISAYNHQYACQYPEEEGVNLYSVKDGWQALSLVNRPGCLCGYCSDNGTFRKWDCQMPHCASDWRADLYKEE